MVALVAGCPQYMRRKHLSRPALPPWLPLRQVVAWLGALVVAAVTVTVCRVGHADVLRSIVLEGSGGTYDPVSSALVPIALAGLACAIVANDGKDVLNSGALAFRSAISVIGPGLFCVLTFAGAWALTCGSTTPTFLIGSRNFGLSFLLCCLGRLLLASFLYVACGMVLMFPALLPGTGAVGRVLGIALWPAELTRDLAVASLCLLGGLLVLLPGVRRSWAGVARQG